MAEARRSVHPPTRRRLPLWVHVSFWVALALVVAVTATLGVAWLLTDRWRIWEIDPQTGSAGPSPEYGLPGAIRTALLIVAGLGGIVGLVVAYRRQRLLELDSQGQRDATRLFTERFGAAANQLGDASAVTRLAGVYAMAALADEWQRQRQQCIDVLCAYIRLPYQPEDHDTDTPRRRTTSRTWQVDQGERKEETTTENRPGEGEVRKTIFRVIRDHLLPEDPVWAGMDFDFTGARITDADFSGALFSAGTVSFSKAAFSGGTVDFSEARFMGAKVNFSESTFDGGKVDFSMAEFDCGEIDLSKAAFSGGQVDFSKAKFYGGAVEFSAAKFFGGRIAFFRAVFSGGTVDFDLAHISEATVSFESARISGGTLSFSSAALAGGSIEFILARFSGGRLEFYKTEFSGGTVNFYLAEFSGGQVDFNRAQFNGSTLHFSAAKFSGSSFIRVDGSKCDAPPPVSVARLTDGSRPTEPDLAAKQP